MTAFRDAIGSADAVRWGNSEDALKTLGLVYRIYYSDESWRDRFDIAEPGAVLQSLLPWPGSDT